MPTSYLYRMGCGIVNGMDNAIGSLQCLSIYIYVYRRFRGASPARPTPVIGSSASVCFRFVTCLRAGEAKLCGRM